jgi:hypothetical protein
LPLICVTCAEAMTPQAASKSAAAKAWSNGLKRISVVSYDLMIAGVPPGSGGRA